MRPVLDPGAGVVLVRDFGVVMPAPTGARARLCLTQCAKILVARNLHMPGGYAAVGEVLKPPSEDSPIMAWP